MTTWEIRQGDCIERMRELDDASIDAVVCDPPYGLSAEPKTAEVLQHWLAGDDYQHRGGGFMGNTWDSFVPGPAVWREAIRVLRPGGHLLAFAGSRTVDLMGIAIRLAGFELRDSLIWLYGSGFPKSLDVSKALDRVAGAERDVPRSWGANGEGHDPKGTLTGREKATGWCEACGRSRGSQAANCQCDTTGTAITPEAQRWQGWGTALKPSHEPIVVARKPLIGTVAANVLEHGTGAINVDGCRIGTDEAWHGDSAPSDSPNGFGPGDADGWEGAWTKRSQSHDGGRWPANVALSPEAAAELDEQSGELTSGANPTRRGSDKLRTAYGDFEGQRECQPARGVDVGGASRFFYVAKAGRSERNAGCEAFEKRPLNWSSGEQNPGSFQAEGTEKAARNFHPTVKPISLMRWLCRLVTPPGGLVLDPFTGSGTTGCAAVMEGFRFIGCEREDDYVAIADARIAFWAKHPGAELDEVLGSDAIERKHRDAGQDSLFSEAA